jgi:hypothetical protein
MLIAIIIIMSLALEEEGILRVGGSVQEIAELKANIENGIIDFRKRDPHAVASLLKSFFRQERPPLYTSYLFSLSLYILQYR